MRYDNRFIAIVCGDITAWVRADQILGIDESNERVLVRVAYMPPDQWLQSDDPAMHILRRIAMREDNDDHA